MTDSEEVQIGTDPNKSNLYKVKAPSGLYIRDWELDNLVVIGLMPDQEVVFVVPSQIKKFSEMEVCRIFFHGLFTSNEDPMSDILTIPAGTKLIGLNGEGEEAFRVDRELSCTISPGFPTRIRPDQECQVINIIGQDYEVVIMGGAARINLKCDSEACDQGEAINPGQSSVSLPPVSTSEPVLISPTPTLTTQPEN
jgi:hypothetical protein